MRTVTFADRRVRKALSGFACAWENTKGDPNSGGSFRHAGSEAAVPLIRGVGNQNVQALFLTPDGRLVHVLAGYWGPQDLLHELELVRAALVAAKRDAETAKDVVARLHLEHARKDANTLGCGSLGMCGERQMAALEKTQAVTGWKASHEYMGRHALLPVERFRSEDLVGRTPTFFGALLGAGGRQEKQGKKPDPRKRLLAALTNTSKGRGFHLNGECKTSGSHPLLAHLALGHTVGTLDGEVEGVADDQGRLHVTVGSRRRRLQVWSDGARFVQQLTCRGRMMDTSATCNQLLSLLDLARVAEHVRRSRSVKEGATRKLGGQACCVIKARLDAEVIRKQDEGSGTDQGSVIVVHPGGEVSDVVYEAWIGQEDGLLHHFEARVSHRGAGTLITTVTDGRGGGVEKDKTSRYGVRTEYSITLKKVGNSERVKFPKDVERLLGD